MTTQFRKLRCDKAGCDQAQDTDATPRFVRIDRLDLCPTCYDEFKGYVAAVKAAHPAGIPAWRLDKVIQQFFTRPDYATRLVGDINAYVARMTVKLE